MSAEVIYIRPTEAEDCPHCGQSVQPKWMVAIDDPEFEPNDGYDTRGEAKQAALEARDDLQEVVLLRADGSVHSQMRAKGEPDERTKARRRRNSEIVVEGGTAVDGGDS